MATLYLYQLCIFNVFSLHVPVGCIPIEFDSHQPIFTDHHHHIVTNTVLHKEKANRKAISYPTQWDTFCRTIHHIWTFQLYTQQHQRELPIITQNVSTTQQKGHLPYQ